MNSDTELRATVTLLRKGVKVQSGKKTRILITHKKKRVYILELEDVLFHFDSPVLLPDTTATGNGTAQQQRINGLAVLRTCYDHAETHTNQKLLIAGHTDTTGSEAYNIELSQMRADNVLFALLGDRDRWVEISNRKHQVEDYQQILKCIECIGTVLVY